jgi:hypothetical protein
MWDTSAATPGAAGDTSNNDKWSVGTCSFSSMDSGWPIPPAAPITEILDTDCRWRDGEWGEASVRRCDGEKGGAVRVRERE